MGQIIAVDVSELKLWLENYRFGSVENEEDALKKLAETRNFNALVASIRKHGFQLNNLLTVSKDKTEDEKYLVYAGNRRLAAVRQCAEVQTLQVYEENDTEALNAILAREHRNDPAGRLGWTSVQQARWEISRYNQKLIENLPQNATCLQMLEKAQGKALDSDFPLTTFERIYESSDFSEKFSISEDGVTINENEQIIAIIEDITAKKINSRNLNRANSVSEYLKRLFEGKSQDERTGLG